MNYAKMLQDKIGSTQITLRILRYLFIGAILTYGDPNILTSLSAWIQSWV